MVTGAAPFVGGLLVLQMLGEEPHGPIPTLVAALSFVLGGLLPWLAQNTMGLLGNRSLRSKLRQRVISETQCDLEGAQFVGFSPGELLHVWQGDTDRDVGFLSITPSTIIYRGDDFAWTLPRDQIDHIDLTPVEAGLQRVLIRWHVPRETGRTFSLESREACSLSSARRATVTLYQRLREWHRAEPAADAVPEAGELALGLPPTDMSGAQIIEEPASGSCTVILALGIIVTIAIWRISGAFFAFGHYYEGILWAGLISVLGALVTGYLLHYLQAWEAEHGRQKQRAR